MRKIIFICFVFVSTVLAAQEKKIAWDYPIKPGTEEWKTTSFSEKEEKAQPVKELLNSWTTNTLFKYCIDYPFNKVALLFNNPGDGFKRVYAQSSVWQEFTRRKDACEVFVRYFEARPYKQLLKIENVETRNEELFVMFFLEKVISETDFVFNINSTEKIKLADVILKNHQDKKDFPDEFLGFNYNSSLSAILAILDSGKVLSKNETLLEKFRETTDNEYFTDNDTESVIETKAIDFINGKL